ncbi:MAG: SCO family protein [Paracoccaceae bacterium]
MRLAGAAALALALAAPLRAETPPPFPVTIEADFDLVAHDGRRVASADLAGRHYLLFFGYAGCEAICDVALARMAEALDRLDARGLAVPAYMVTIDPERDDPGRLAATLGRLHERLVGLTGPDAALAAVWDAFQVSREVVYTDPAGQPVFAHTSFVYLIGPDGRVASALPPIVDAAHLAETVARRLDASG